MSFPIYSTAIRLKFHGEFAPVVFGSNAVLFTYNQGTETWVYTGLQELHLKFAHKVACMLSPPPLETRLQAGCKHLSVPTPQTELIQGE